MAQWTGFEENLDARAMEEDWDESALGEREATDFQGREELDQSTSKSEVSEEVYLACISFTLVVDHQPLVPILNGYSLDQVENPRLQRLQ